MFECRAKKLTHPDLCINLILLSTSRYFFSSFSAASQSVSICPILYLYNFYRIHNILSKLIAFEWKSGTFYSFSLRSPSPKNLFFCQYSSCHSSISILKIAQWIFFLSHARNIKIPFVSHEIIKNDGDRRKKDFSHLPSWNEMQKFRKN